MQPEALDVAVISAIGIDTNVYLGKDEIDFEVESNFTSNIDYVGQAGGFASRGFARLGQQTAFIGYVGDDYNGRFVRDELERDGIEALLLIDPQGTRRSVNFMYRDGRRKNFYDGKGAMNLQPDLASCRRVLERCRLAHFNIENWARYLLPLAKELGLTISCDVQDLVTVDDPYRQDFIEYADILFFSSANLDDPAPLMEGLLRSRPERILVAGMGSRGCAMGTGAGVRFFEPVRMEEPVIDTNGAGDGLAVGFLTSYYLDRGFSPEEALRRGQITARYSCTQRAASDHLITPEQLAYYYGQR